MGRGKSGVKATASESSPSYDRANASWQNAMREASEILRQNGLSRYDRVGYVSATSAQRNAYEKLKEQAVGGVELKRRMSDATATVVRDLAQNELLRAAKRVYGLDVDRNALDGGAKELTDGVASFRRNVRANEKIYEYAQNQLRRKIPNAGGTRGYSGLRT